MPNTTDDYKIRVTMDRSDAVTGAQEVSDSVKRVGEATEESGKGFGKLAEEASSMRESRRIATDLFDVMRGGGETVEGVTGLFRVLLVTMADVNPVLGALALVSGALIGLAAKQDDHKQKIDDTKTSTDTLKGATQELETQAATSYGGMLSQLREISTEMKAQVEAAHDLQKARDLLQNAQMAKELADLDEDEQLDLSGKDAAQQLAIKQKYEQQAMAIRQKYAVQAAQQEVADKQQAVAEAQAALAANRKESAATGDDLSRAWDLVNGGAASALAAAGVKSDAQRAADRLAELQALQTQRDSEGQMRGLSAKEAIEYDQLQRDLPGLQTSERRQGPSTAGTLADLQAQQKQLQDYLKDVRDPGWLSSHWDAATGGDPEARAQKDMDQIAAVTAQIDAINKYQADLKAAKDEIAKSVPKFQDLNGAVDALKTKIQAAQVGFQTAQTKLDTLGATQRKDIFTLDQKQDEEKAEQALKDADAIRAKQKADLEAELKAATDAAQKGLLQQEIADIVAKGDTEKAAFDLKYGKIDKTQYDAEIGKASDVQKAARNQAQQEAQKQATKAETKSTEASLKQVTGQIEATGNKDLISAAHGIIKTVLNKQEELVQLQALFAEAANGKFQEIDNGMREQKRQIDQLNRSRKNNAQS